MAPEAITSIRGIGPRRAEAFGSLGLFSLYDLARFAPRDYLDYTKQTAIPALEHGRLAAVRVALPGPAKQVRIRRGLTMTVARAAGASGADKLELVWYNQPYRAKSVRAGMTVYACGRVDRRRGIKLVNAVFYDELPGIVPVYPTAEGLSQKVVRDAVAAALHVLEGKIKETLPEFIRERYQLMPLEAALRAIHAPENFDALEQAKRRLAFEDMLLYCLMISILRSERKRSDGMAFRTLGLRADYLMRLPYRPTAAQSRAMEEIERDMASSAQMNRLLQGDVGSGKTMVAMYAMYVAVKNGKTAALMAPTEILAAQHYETLRRVFGEDAVLLTGGMKAAERRAALAKIASKPCAIAGTHALISEGLELDGLGLVIADEQHRFGVRQRAAITAKGGLPDTLIMSATPIPRTLSLLLYGDLDVSVLDELPPGRKPVVTRVVPPAKRDDMYRFIGERIQKGAQAFAVCPLVEPSEALEGVLGAKELCGELSQKLGGRVGLIHGKLAEKDAVAEAFRRGEIDLLVATTVVEVGVDVPNAGVMVVENAERFGLAQLHQLRGRVGRGTEEAYCFLLSAADSGAARERLSVLVSSNDGFEIARRDLELRGPGEFLGTRQHGMDCFAAARFAADLRTVNDAREAAELIAHLDGAEAEALVGKARKLLEEKENIVAKN